MAPGRRSRGIATTFLALLLAVALAACGSSTPSGSPSPGASASPTPLASSAAPTPSATPPPSPTPKVDAAKPFLALFTSGTFTATATITGTVTLGTTSYPVTGTLDIRGADNRQSMTINSQTTESIKVGGVAYNRQGGLWFEKPAAPAGSPSNADLASSMRSILDLVDVGTVTKNGQTLHHLEPRGGTGIPLSAIGASDPTGDGVVSVDFYAEADGTPVVMSISASWSQPSGKTTERASMAIDYAFSNVGGRVVVAAPIQVWKTFKSKRFGYSIAYPIDWDGTHSPAKGEPDEFWSADATGVFVWRYATKGLTLNAITSGYVGQIKRGSKASVASNKATTVDGSKARRLEWTAVFDGTREYATEILVVRGKYVYFIMYGRTEKLTDSDRALFDAFLSTVDLPS